MKMFSKKFFNIDFYIALKNIKKLKEKDKIKQKQSKHLKKVIHVPPFILNLS